MASAWARPQKQSKFGGRLPGAKQEPSHAFFVPSSKLAAFVPEACTIRKASDKEVDEHLSAAQREK